MSRRDPRAARLLGLWTATWLGALLLAGLLRVGDLSVQWPVLLVPVLWALMALRPRRGDGEGWAPPSPEPRAEPGWHDPAQRTDTVERPAVRPRDRHDEWH